MILKKEKRVEYYLGSSSSMIFDGFKREFVRGELCFYNTQEKHMTPGSYIRDLRAIVSRNSSVTEKKFEYPVLFGDQTFDTDSFFFTKARNIKTRSGVLLRLNKKRHWEKYIDFQDPLAFEEKLCSVVWRGATTGHGPFRKNPRFVFVSKFIDKFDVGFSKLCQGKKCEELIRPELTIDEHLQYKYIVVIEGNDVATSLKWVLMSNSIPFMQPPTKETWLMEGLLEPFVHYIPLNEDFSDLEEKVEWANENPDKALDIVENGKLFMKMFEDEASECWIEDAIMKSYIKKLEGFGAKLGESK